MRSPITCPWPPRSACRCRWRRLHECARCGAHGLKPARYRLESAAMNAALLMSASRWILPRRLVFLLLFVPLLAHAQPATLQQQREAFRAAYAAASNGQDWRPLAQGLEGYPLYPYLEAAALEHDLEHADRAQIAAYLAKYPDLIPAQDLRRDELALLAKQKDWNGFLAFYQPGLGDALTCDALQAKLSQGGKLDFSRDLSALWEDRKSVV